MARGSFLGVHQFTHIHPAFIAGVLLQFGAVDFARIEGILPAPESSHAICVAIKEAMKCKETGEPQKIVFGLTGTGYFDMVAYEKHNSGTLTDYVPTDEEIAKALEKLPKLG